jgi:hypothetical protein
MPYRNRDVRSSTIVIFPLFLLVWMVSNQPVKAERVCQVTDPTSTPLNVRDRPTGRVVNALRNGREVYIHETAYDRQGCPWF